MNYCRLLSPLVCWPGPRRHRKRPWRPLVQRKSAASTVLSLRKCSTVVAVGVALVAAECAASAEAGSVAADGASAEVAWVGVSEASAEVAAACATSAEVAAACAA